MIGKYTWAEFSRRCSKHSIAHGKVLTREEVLEDEQVKHSGILVTPDGFDGQRMPKPAPMFGTTPCSLRSPAAALGAHNAELGLPIVK